MQNADVNYNKLIGVKRLAKYKSDFFIIEEKDFAETFTQQ